MDDPQHSNINPELVAGNNDFNNFTGSADGHYPSYPHASNQEIPAQYHGEPVHRFQRPDANLLVPSSALQPYKVEERNEGDGTGEGKTYHTLQVEGYNQPQNTYNAAAGTDQTPIHQPVPQYPDHRGGYEQHRQTAMQPNATSISNQLLESYNQGLPYSMVQPSLAFYQHPFFPLTTQAPTATHYTPHSPDQPLALTYYPPAAVAEPQSSFSADQMPAQQAPNGSMACSGASAADDGLYTSNNVIDEASPSMSSPSPHQQQARNMRLGEYDDDGVDVDLIKKRRVPKDLCKKSAYNARWGMKSVSNWLQNNGFNRDPRFLSSRELVRVLPRFYREVRKKNGGYYSKNSLFNVRAMLNSYLKKVHDEHLDIVEDLMFRRANNVFEEQLRYIQNRTGPTTDEIITDDDLEFMQESGVFSRSRPETLFLKIWFDLTVHFRQHTELSQLDWRVDMLVFMFDPSLRKYYVTWHTPNRDGRETRMYETLTNTCPIHSLICYLTKLTPFCTCLFQRIRRNLILEKDIWFGPEAVGLRTLQKLMTRISDASSLSKRYTNLALARTDVNPIASIQYQPGVTAHGIPGYFCSKVDASDIEQQRAGLYQGFKMMK